MIVKRRHKHFPAMPKKRALSPSAKSKNIGSPVTSLKTAASASSTPKGVSKASSLTAVEPMVAGESQRGPTGAGDGKVRSPYELVRPKRVVPGETWLQSEYADDESALEPIGTRWWLRKEKKERKKAAVQVGLLFAFVIILIVALLAVGFYFMHLKRSRAKHGLDTRLTTKTSLCRATISHDHDHADATHCITEMEQLYASCSHSEPMCRINQWKFRYDGTNENNFVLHGIEPSVHEFNIETTDHADCGDLQWCQNEECVQSGLKPDQWWPAGDAPIHEIGVLVPTQKIDEWSCLEHQTPETKKLIEILNSLIKSKCNKDMCQQPEAKVALQVIVYECDLNEDVMTGLRNQPCDLKENFLKIKVCDNCLQNASDAQRALEIFRNDSCGGVEPTARNDNCFYDCPNNARLIMPNGAECGEDGGWYCLLGQCYAPFTGDTDYGRIQGIETDIDHSYAMGEPVDEDADSE